MEEDVVRAKREPSVLVAISGAPDRAGVEVLSTSHQRISVACYQIALVGGRLGPGTLYVHRQ
jgi:hypothetical protein